MMLQQAALREGAHGIPALRFGSTSQRINGSYRPLNTVSRITS
jgi:hypothetical protein